MSNQELPAVNIPRQTLLSVAEDAMNSRDNADLLAENLKLWELVELQESLLGNIQTTINTGDYFDRLSWPDLRHAITAAKEGLG